MNVDQLIHPALFPEKPVSEQVVRCLARLANDLEVLKENFHEPMDSACLTLAKHRIQRVALLHDAAAGYALFASTPEEGIEGEPADDDRSEYAMGQEVAS